MKKAYVILLFLLAFLLASCTTQIEPPRPVCNEPYILVGTGCCLDSNDNSICDSDEPEEPEEDGLGEITGQVVAGEVKEPEKEGVGYYDLEQLGDDINEIKNTSIIYDFARDPGYNDYVRSNHLKHYAIHTISDKNEHIETAEKFCEEYCAKDWDGWEYFINNMSDYKWLHPILVRENFSSDYEYRDYIQNAGYVNITVIEKSYNVENGKVLEYQLLPWVQSLFGQFLGAYDETQLVYKVYCSPNMTVLMRPEWDEIQVSFPVTTMDETRKTWDNHIIPLRKRFLSKANELLARCPVEKEFFEGYAFPDYEKSELLAVYWKSYFKFYLNMTESLDIGVEPSRSEGKYLLKEINLSFTNNDYFELYELALNVDVIMDDKRQKDHYDKRVVGILRPGKSVDRNFKIEDGYEFSDNVTIEAKLYTVFDKGEIRPLRITYSKEDFIKE